MQPKKNINSSSWDTLEPLFDALLKTDLAPPQISEWLEKWSNLEKTIWEIRAGFKRDRSRDETNDIAQKAYQNFVEEIFIPYQNKSQALKTKLLGITNYIPAPEHVQMLRNLRAEAALYRQENIPLQANVNELSNEYGNKQWSLTVEVDSKTIPLPEVEESVATKNQGVREHAWRLVWTCWKRERTFFDQLFINLVQKRRQIAHNAGFSDYRAYRWQERGRFDYTPQDCLNLHEAIEKEIIPLSRLCREARRQSLGLKSIQPWNQEYSSEADILLNSFVNISDFEATLLQIYRQIDPELGTLFERMSHGYLDLGSRPGKPHGGEEWIFPVTGLPYLRAYTVGTYGDINLVLHESGHAFHDALSLAQQKLFWNMGGPDEFCEFAAIAMTYLAKPYLEQKRGGIFTPEMISRIYHKELEDVVVKWLPIIAQVDAFQHWVYTTAPENITPTDLDTKWLELSYRFDSGIDWAGLEQERALGWQRVGIIFSAPFYQIEYALAHLGALQIWQKAQYNHAPMWQVYRGALLLGDTRPLPELYRAAGAELPFEYATVKKTANFLAEYFEQYKQSTHS